MTRFPCLPLAAVVTVLGAASVATADFVTQPVTFKSDFSGFYPGGPAVSWSIDHDLEVTYNQTTGRISTGLYQDVMATFVFGGEQITVTTEIYFSDTEQYYYDMKFLIPDAPFGFGPMEIQVYGAASYAFGLWFGEMEASISSGSGFFGDEETYDVDFSAAVIPAPGAVAVLGLAGMVARRRRD